MLICGGANLKYKKHVYNEMTNEAERTPKSNTQAEFTKQYGNKKTKRWSDESNNACLKVTEYSSLLCNKPSLWTENRVQLQ